MDSRSKNQKTIETSMKNLKVDAALKPSEANMSGPREGSLSDVTSCISSVDATASSIKGSEVDQEPFAGDQGMYYYGYCYPGFSSPLGEWDDQSYYMPSDNFEFQPSAAQAYNGSLLYYLPGYQPGYSSAVGIEGQYLGQPSYYSSPMLQQPRASLGLAPQSFAYGAELVPVYPWDPALLLANGLQVHGFYGDPSILVPKSSFSSRIQNHVSSKMSPPLKSSTSETKGSSLGADAKPVPAAPKSVNKGSAVLSKGYIPISKIPTYANQGKGGLLCPNRPIDVKESGRNWVGVEKLAARTKLYGLGDFDLNEQNRGPRTNSNKNTVDSEVNLVGSPVAGKNGNICAVIPSVRKDMYNLPDFSTKYDHALFFVIKSYSEDDIHKSIKYNVWASTSNGNRRLDNAFQLAQQKMAEKGSRCPVFLFFSVNASGQFCGVAEIKDRVDFNKNMDFWQQDKWNGYFPVRWHIIKDVPNSQFRHILLENNENKPVTNSRDTQEVLTLGYNKNLLGSQIDVIYYISPDGINGLTFDCDIDLLVMFPRGTEMLNIFKNYVSRTSILDDFDFYESRQKIMQHKRSKPPVMHFEYPSPKMEELMHAPNPDDLKTISCPNPSVEVEAGK